MSERERPLSPHLTIYKPQITSVLSILHRFTGVGLGGVLSAIVWFLVDLAFVPVESSFFLKCMATKSGAVVISLGLFCWFYHLFNGIRHILWDVGWGFSKAQVFRTGWMVVVGSLGITGLSLIYIIKKGGFSLWFQAV